jgi:hypothetical protein
MRRRAVSLAPIAPASVCIQRSPVVVHIGAPALLAA